MYKKLIFVSIVLYLLLVTCSVVFSQVEGVTYINEESLIYSNQQISKLEGQIQQVSNEVEDNNNKIFIGQILSALITAIVVIAGLFGINIKVADINISKKEEEIKK